MQKYRTIMFKKEDALLLKITARILGYHSISEYVMALHAVRLKMAWDKGDIFSMSVYGRVPEVETVTAPNEKEALKKLGLEKAKKIGDSEQNEPLNVEKMPTSEKFFEKKETK
jgi:hypothetical protein